MLIKSFICLLTYQDRLKLSCFDYEMVAYILSLNFTISLQIPFLLFRLTRPLLCFTTTSSTRRRSKQLIAAKSKHFCGELTTPTHTHTPCKFQVLACLFVLYYLSITYYYFPGKFVCCQFSVGLQ